MHQVAGAEPSWRLEVVVGVSMSGEGSTGVVGVDDVASVWSWKWTTLLVGSSDVDLHWQSPRISDRG
jgi:hypothetical protein